MNEEEKAQLKKKLEKIRIEPEDLRQLSSVITQKLAKRKQEIQKILDEVEGGV
jgi:SMC interacting uncharacterized protein involved in chromosome segregation